MADTLPASYIAAKNTLHATAPWVWLVEADRDGTNAIRLAGYDSAVVYGGNTYSAFPIGVGGITRDLDGNRQPLEITVSNVSREIGGLLEDGEFVGRTVKLLLVLSSDLTSAQDWGTWVVKGATVALDRATFALGLPGDASAQVPARRILRGRCDYRYGDFECGYSTSLPNAISGTNPNFDPTTCDLTLEGENGCRVHGDNEVANGRARLHPLRHGACPSIPRGPARV
jgi:phage-related protein